MNDSFVAMGNGACPLVYQISQRQKEGKNEVNASGDDSESMTKKPPTYRICRRVAGLAPIENLEIARCIVPRRRHDDRKGINVSSGTDDSLSTGPRLLLIACSELGQIVAWDLNNLDAVARVSSGNNDKLIPTSVHSFPVRGSLYDGTIGDVEPFQWARGPKGKAGDASRGHKSPLSLTKELSSNDEDGDKLKRAVNDTGWIPTSLSDKDCNNKDVGRQGTKKPNPSRKTGKIFRLPKSPNGRKRSQRARISTFREKTKKLGAKKKN